MTDSPQIFQRQLTLHTANSQVLEQLNVLAPELSNAQLKEALTKGAIWLQTSNQKQPERVRRAKRKLSLGDQIFINYNAEVLTSTCPPAKLVADLADYSVWYKSKGMLSQGSKWADHTTLNRFVETLWQKPCWIVHRLDKATDGLMLLAHTKKMAQTLSRMFENNQIKKAYQARVKGHFPVENQTLDQPVNGKSALSYASLLNYDTSTDESLIHVHIETGRKHQIRQHLAQFGFPIIGDRLYGGELDERDLQLTAVQLTLLGESAHLQQTFDLKEIKDIKDLL